MLRDVIEKHDLEKRRDDLVRGVGLMQEQIKHMEKQVVQMEEQVADFKQRILQNKANINATVAAISEADYWLGQIAQYAPAERNLPVPKIETRIPRG